MGTKSGVGWWDNFVGDKLGCSPRLSVNKHIHRNEMGLLLTFRLKFSDHASRKFSYVLDIGYKELLCNMQEKNTTSTDL